jgi:uncharacterized membrane protein YgaE (UPF0421/DUF939 family)
VPPGIRIAPRMSALFRPVTRNTVLHSARTTIAVLLSILLASFVLKLPGFYWAPVSAVVILLSATDPMKLAWQRFAGTALGAVFGALIATYLGQSWIVYGFGIFIAGIVSALLHVSTAYRFAAITLTIVMCGSPHALHTARGLSSFPGGLAGNRSGTLTDRYMAP